MFTPDRTRLITGILGALRRAHAGLRRTEHMYMVLVSIVIGAAAGYGAVGFRLLIRFVSDVAWHDGDQALAFIAGLPVWWKILAPSAGGLIVGLITYRFAREVKGHGVPEVMEAVAVRGGRIRVRVVLAKLLASGVCIGTGGSVGREGPIVQIGSALGSAVGQWLRIDRQRLRTLVGCGAGAGIAATFNAPIAGALFAVEVILGDFGVTQFSPIVIASVTGTVVSHHYLGNFPAFQLPTYSLETATELFAYAGLGLLAGVVAIGFTRVLYSSEDLFNRSPIPPMVRPILGGALVGVIGIWLPQVFGVGYGAINLALNGSAGWQLMLILVLAKLVAVSITIGSGGSGGVFAPSLFLGAMTGGAVGTGVHALWPNSTASSGAYALVGMGAVVAAATHAPITSIVIIFELTGEYSIILPLMITCIIATLVSTRLERASIYTLKLLRRGVDVHGGRAINVLQSVPVREEMRDDVPTVDAGEGIITLVSRFMDYTGNVLFVVDEDRHLLGVIRRENLPPTMNDAISLGDLVIADDLMTQGDYPVVAGDDSLAHVMGLLSGFHGEIPVVEKGRLVGVVRPRDVIERYNQELFRRDMARGMAAVMSTEGAEPVPTVENNVVVAIPLPAPFVGKSIRSLDIRRVFGFSILLIRKPGETAAGQAERLPSADHVFEAGETIVVMGPKSRLRSLKRGEPPKSRSSRKSR